VLLQAGALTVAPTGRITADGTSDESRAASAGGTVLLRGDARALGSAQVSAEGGVEPSLFGGPTVAASLGVRHPAVPRRAQREHGAACVQRSGAVAAADLTRRLLRSGAPPRNGALHAAQ
jgi:hypothetical protein